VTLRGAWGRSLSGVTWGLAIVGSLQHLRILSVVVYLLMGWAAVMALVLRDCAGLRRVCMGHDGRLFYTVGITFYALDARLNHARGIWHLCVLAGSASHFVAVIIYVV
jgi:hemolysin III